MTSPAARRPLHLIVLADCSPGMGRLDLQAVSFGLAETMQQLGQWEEGQDGVQVLFRAIAYPRAHWHIADPVPLRRLHIPPLQTVNDRSYLAPACRLAASVLAEDMLEPDALPPALLLISKVRPQDQPADLEAGLAALAGTPGGSQAKRAVIGFYRDYDTHLARRFTGHAGRIDLVTNLDDLPGKMASATRWLIARCTGDQRHRRPAGEDPAVQDDIAL